MTYDTLDEGNLLLFPDINNLTPSSPPLTFNHPIGLLFVTQFAQIALVVTKKAAFKDMCFKGFSFLLKLATGFSGVLGNYNMSLIACLRPSRSDGVLLLTTSIEPSKRLAFEAEGKSWLSDVVQSYTQRLDVSFVSPGATAGAAGSMGGATTRSEEFLELCK